MASKEGGGDKGKVTLLGCTSNLNFISCLVPGIVINLFCRFIELSSLPKVLETIKKRGGKSLSSILVNI